MTMLEKIVFLADYIEPGRKMIPGLSDVRSLAFTNIDRAVCLCSKQTLSYLEKSGRSIDPMTRETFLYYSEQKNKMPQSETAYNVEVETVQAKEMAKIAYHALDEKREKTSASLILRESRYWQIILLLQMVPVKVRYRRW